MKLANFRDSDGASRLGVLSVSGDRLVPLHEGGLEFPGMIELIAAWSDDLRAAVARLAGGSGGMALDGVRLDAPIPHPRHDIICIGQNYLEHALESCRYKGVEYEKPAHPTYFSKRVDRAVPPDGVIKAHADITDKLDYETELAVVIGRPCDHVKPEDVFDHVFGYTIVNDVSARDLQHAHVQYTFGKGLDGATPMGPWIVTRDEFRDPPRLDVVTRVNGELRQNSNTDQFIFDIPYLIAELSTGIVLGPGDLLATGTPSGVGLGLQPPRFLKPGDTIESEIEGIGVLRNVVR